MQSALSRIDALQRDLDNERKKTQELVCSLINRVSLSSLSDNRVVGYEHATTW
jgi:hypothetical protein